MDTRDLSAKKIHEGLKEKAFSATEVTRAYLDQIARHNGELNVFLDVYEESATEAAQKVDEKIAAGGEVQPMTGVPVATKDNILIDGEKATAGSKMLENYTATYDAGVVKKLKQQGAVFLGKTNMDEFAMGSSNENSAFGLVRNPHDLTRVPGGSSGGSAAAVAAHMAPLSLGSDTGGSIRQPAHFCGVVGFKPTYGAVSRSGLIALASSLDQIGPFANTVEDAAWLFAGISGRDPYDNTSREYSYDPQTLQDMEKYRGMTIGLPDEYFIPGTEEVVAKNIQAVIKSYESLGVQFKRVSLPHTKYALSTYYIIQPAEASSNLARFDGVRYGRFVEDGQSLRDIYVGTKSAGFGAEAKRRILLGTFVLSSGYYDAYYKKAVEAKEYITEDFTKAFQTVDAILAPTAPTPAFKLGEKVDDPMQMYLSDIFTIPANLAGIPAISIPSRENDSLLPIGFQLMGPKWKDADILGLGHLYQSA
ncbi:MAG: Asp-tRNA(Asn)/Glu-tRNA(Gln) amidotransferase GatCAB subunit A [Candidatus Harrisonbacteria bacterium CG10_big_fil_rev_8_21_14_0_10_49_15]|uniref:Glutamyl-tRNA(Gln) amidotransferase subunit A n=1 Tax=Candidatus Harrisonbacteria bacterium CG10_big_fil_rev_8_21_14_0_10_49_15 TaxID=1974587 RepID=A0A2H0ULX4_9BACT|nr:MAG: Asp-tRNA(Asn)/Glu-tRNA(Gln) amidotransferase GatCAB subunit A [Candidatus Harrisonbacteria bacterium CG10_big_fil_rev_8_21_14_0_10_49_15]